MIRMQGGESENIISLIQAANKGDAEARDRVIRSYLPLLNAVLSEQLQRFVSPCEDEYSIGLIALDEAILKYDNSKGAGFSGFCRLVIRRRIIDYLRKKHRNTGKEIVGSATENETGNSSINAWMMKESKQQWLEQIQTSERAAEIKRLDAELRRFNITFLQLTACAPKQQPARRRAAQIANYLAEHRQLFLKLQTKGTLPIQDLKLSGKYSHKILERQRRYIIALAVIINGDYPYLNYYINNLLNGVD